MNPYANMGCILRVNTDCEACKMKVLEVVGSIVGLYNITIDAEKGLADITGQVDPNNVLYALAQSGQHAQLVKIKLQHPATNYNNPYYNYGGNALGMHDMYGLGSHYGGAHHQPYPIINDPYWYSRRPHQPTPFSHSNYHRPNYGFGHMLPPRIRNGGCHMHHHGVY